MLSPSEDGWTVALLSNRPEVKDLVCYALRKMSPKVTVFEPKSPHRLIEEAASLPLLAVITGYKLFGEIDGLKLASELRNRGFRQPILMLSNSEEVAPFAKAAGIDEFLSLDQWLELPARLSHLVSLVVQPDC